MQIDISNLTFSYAKKTSNIINDLSFHIKEGSINVLLGLNGCGKTTLIKILAGLLPYETGSISYDGKELKNMSIFERSKTFSYVPQRTYIADDFYVIDYLSYGLANSLRFYKTPSKEQMDNVYKLSEKLGITHLLKKKMGNISGGERQIVTIASCLIQDTPIILLDEPTSALDLKNQNLILTLLKTIVSEGKTIILSSHNPNHASFLDSDVALINEGKIVKNGNSSAIINKDTLTSIYGDNICYADELKYKEVSFK